MRAIILACALLGVGCTSAPSSITRAEKRERLQEERAREIGERVKDEFNALVPNG